MYCLNRHVHTKRRQTNERERLFELEIRRTKGFEVKKMLEDGNCLFRAVADQVYGDPEAYDLARQMCLDYMVHLLKCTIRNIDKDQVKAAIRAQQDQQIDNVSTVAYALVAEGRFYSDLELTEKEIERMVMEASRAEYLAENKVKQYPSFRESSTSRAEPSSSVAILFRYLEFIFVFSTSSTPFTTKHSPSMGAGDR
ncbi:hypothetical protein GW17_00035938 [Ensete ventricosum]|nr:hypothetical protein GW17_00035938 [Ensete ventricosum]